MTFKWFVALLCAFTFNTFAGAASLTVNGSGLLTGAQDVDVNGVLYDVEFREGTFSSVFGSAANLDADTVNEGLWFNDALLTQVFINGGLGSFDSNPALTYGCTGGVICVAWTPYIVYPDTSLTAAYARNGDEINYIDVTADQLLLGTYNSSSDIYAVWADWTLASPPPVVPIPPAVWLFGSALGLMGVMRRKRIS